MRQSEHVTCICLITAATCLGKNCDFGMPNGQNTNVNVDGITNGYAQGFTPVFPTEHVMMHVHPSVADYVPIFGAATEPERTDYMQDGGGYTVGTRDIDGGYIEGAAGQMSTAALGHGHEGYTDETAYGGGCEVGQDEPSTFHHAAESNAMEVAELLLGSAIVKAEQRERTQRAESRIHVYPAVAQQQVAFTGHDATRAGTDHH